MFYYLNSIINLKSCQEQYKKPRKVRGSNVVGASI